MIKILLKQIGDYKRDTIITPVFTVLEVVAELLVPFVIASLIDKGIEAGNLRNVYLYGALMIVLAFFGLAFGILAGRFAASASSGFACNLRQSMFENIQTFSFSNIDKFSTAGLVTRMTTDVTNMQMAFQMCLRIALRAPLMLICSMVMCLLINARLSIIFLAAIVVLAAALALIMSRAMKIFSKVFHRYDDLNASVQENIAAIRVVKAFVREDCENEKFCKAAVRLYELFVRAEKLQALNLPVMMFIVYGCILAISWFGAHFILAGSMTTGSLTSLFSYVMTAFSSLMMLSMIFVMMTMSTASGKRIAEVLEETAGITNPPSTPICQVRDGSVDFNHVAFSYRQGSGEKTLDNVDLHIKSGETIGVIGGTGCGKSSLVSLISRLYDVDSGSVKVGGEDVRNYDLETLRSQVAVVLQKNVLFSGTVLENLSWGKKMGHMDEYREACRMSCADEFLERLPEHYESWVERGGANFSGGQKQRLCIARALLRHPKVLILDDSTSAVDTATDAKIRKALRTVIPGTTKIIIAQRISSVQDADRILVLDSGRISGFDTHENLLKSNAIYREIYEAQTKGGGDFDHEQTVE
nr:ABC transporter ATP-binding protein [uncultured Oscillibacter sp.]